MKFFSLILVLCATAGFASADPILDGMVTAGEYAYQYGPFMPYINGTDGATQNIMLYYTPGGQYAYGAVVADPSKPTAFPGANIYLYSSTPSIDSHGNPGVYGDGNDVLIEGANDFGFASPNPPYILNPQSLNPMTNGNLITGSSANGIQVVINTSTDVEEFRIPVSLLADPFGGQYNQYRLGGQFFAYEFMTGSGDRIPGPLVPGVAAAPEPASIGLFGTALLLFGLRQYRRRPTA